MDVDAWLEGIHCHLHGGRWDDSVLQRRGAPAHSCLPGQDVAHRPTRPQPGVPAGETGYIDSRNLLSSGL